MALVQKVSLKASRKVAVSAPERRRYLWIPCSLSGPNHCRVTFMISMNMIRVASAAKSPLIMLMRWATPSPKGRIEARRPTSTYIGVAGGCGMPMM